MHSLVLTRCLVEDYCLLLPDPSNVFRGLPSISPLFACNLTTSVTTLYDFHCEGTALPLFTSSPCFTLLCVSGGVCCSCFCASMSGVCSTVLSMYASHLSAVLMLMLDCLF